MQFHNFCIIIQEKYQKVDKFLKTFVELSEILYINNIY